MKGSQKHRKSLESVAQSYASICAKHFWYPAVSYDAVYGFESTNSNVKRIKATTWHGAYFCLQKTTKSYIKDIVKILQRSKKIETHI